MSEKLEKKRKQTEAIAETEINEAVTMMHSESDKQRIWMMLGGLKVVNQIQTSLNAQMMRGLQMVRDQKAYEALDYTRFDDFLDNDEHSPMSYRMFNEREKLLMTEGDAAFDVLTQVGLSLRKRKLLGAGHVQIDDSKGTAIIVTEQNGEEKIEEIELTDRTRLLQTLSALADQNAIQNVKLNKQKDIISRGEKQVDNLQRELDDAKLRGGIMSIEGVHLEHFMRVTNSLKAMAEFVKTLPLVEKTKSDEFYCNEIRTAVSELEKTYGHTGASSLLGDDASREAQIKKVLKKSSNEEDDLTAITNNLNDDELAELMN